MATYCLQVPQLLPEFLVRDLFNSLGTLNYSLVDDSNEKVDPKACQKAVTGKPNIKMKTCQEPDLSLLGYKSVVQYEGTSISGDTVPPFQQW